jgi:hypothetical protein
MTDHLILTQSYSGRSSFVADYTQEPDRLLVAVKCLVAGLPTPIYGLLDTASPWSILPAYLAEELGYSLEPEAPTPSLRTGRCGLIAGRLERIWLRFPADDGAALDLNALWYLSADWNRPLVVGWKGCLEAIRLALDPSQDYFYFGSC